MSDEGWISVFDRLPKIGEEVEMVYCIKDPKKITPNDIYINHIWADDYSTYQWHLYKEKGKIATHWRPLKEKRPDFGKLREGDIIYFCVEEIIICGMITFINEELLEISPIIKGYHYGGNVYDYMLNKIKKITRINIEKQTFEEI